MGRNSPPPTHTFLTLNVLLQIISEFKVLGNQFCTQYICISFHSDLMCNKTLMVGYDNKKNMVQPITPQ